MNNQLTFILNSKNNLKEEAVKEILKLHLKKSFTLIKKNLPINFPETPLNKETFLGAKKRAETIIKMYDNEIIAIGLESGLIKRFGILFEEAWCCLIFKNSYFFGYSSGFEIPKIVREKLSKEKHKEVMMRLEKITKISSRDTWGNYSNGLLSRKESLKEAFRNAFFNLLTFIKNDDELL